MNSIKTISVMGLLSKAEAIRIVRKANKAYSLARDYAWTIEVDPMSHRGVLYRVCVTGRLTKSQLTWLAGFATAALVN